MTVQQTQPGLCHTVAHSCVLLLRFAFFSLSKAHAQPRRESGVTFAIAQSHWRRACAASREMCCAFRARVPSVLTCKCVTQQADTFETGPNLLGMGTLPGGDTRLGEGPCGASEVPQPPAAGSWCIPPLSAAFWMPAMG